MSKRQQCLDATRAVQESLFLVSVGAALPQVANALGLLSASSAYGMSYGMLMGGSAGVAHLAYAARKKCLDLPFNLREVRQRMAIFEPITLKQFRQLEDPDSYLFKIKAVKTSRITTFDVKQASRKVWKYTIKIRKADLDYLRQEGELHQMIFSPLQDAIRKVKANNPMATLHVESHSDEFKDIIVQGDEELAGFVLELFPRDG